MSFRKYKGKKLTPQQRKFAKEVVRTGNLRAAYLSAYIPPEGALPSEMDHTTKKLVTEPKVRNEIVRILEQEGVTLKLAAQKHVNILRKKSSSDKAVLDAIDKVYRVHGAYKSPAEEAEGRGISMLNIFIKQSQERGIPIPKEILDGEDQPG